MKGTLTISEDKDFKVQSSELFVLWRRKILIEISEEKSFRVIFLPKNLIFSSQKTFHAF